MMIADSIRERCFRPASCSPPPLSVVVGVKDAKKAAIWLRFAKRCSPTVEVGATNSAGRKKS